MERLAGLNPQKSMWNCDSTVVVEEVEPMIVHPCSRASSSCVRVNGRRHDKQSSKT